MLKDLQGKTALITGGTRGIGLAIANAFAAEGVNSVIVGNGDPEAARLTAKTVEATHGSRCVAVAADLTTADGAASVVEASLDSFGALHILVNCAGGFKGPQALWDIEPDDWDQIMQLNLRSAFLSCRAALPDMMGRRWGRIINISSELGRTPTFLAAAHYAAAKAGLLGLTRHLAREVAHLGITVNATAPGTTFSERVQQNMPDDARHRMSALIPLQRIATVEEQAGAVVFLASDAAAYITGTTIDVSGGKVMQ